MNDQTFLKTQVIDLEHMLEEAKDDPVLAPQLEQRLGATRKTLHAQNTHRTLFPAVTPELPRAAIFLRRGGVEGTTGIRPALAGEALIHYEKMFIEQAIHDEREAARSSGRQRRQRGAAVPALLLTGTPRGSFGLEFTPQLQEDHGLLEVHRHSLQHIAEALMTAAESNSVERLTDAIPAKVLQPLTRFFRTLANFGAELRLAIPGSDSRTISAEQATATAERLERTIEQQEIIVTGVFRGLTRESGYFDLVRDDASTITGVVADAFTEDDLERIDLLTNERCSATLQETRITKAGRSNATFILLEARAADG